MSRILFSHGLGPKPPVDKLESEWREALFQGDQPGVATEMAYWANYRDENLDRFSPQEVEWLQEMSINMDPAVDEITKLFTRIFLKDFYTYMYDEETREEIQRIHREALNDLEPNIIIAHSMGSIICYDTLLQHDKDIPLFITIGCPLGLPFVQASLRERYKADLALPACVLDWANVADSLDVVAADPTLADDFNDTTVTDIRVVNTKRDTAEGPHSGTGYLSTPTVRALVRDFREFRVV